MNYPPQRNSTQFFREWKLRQPYVYRYLKKDYVDLFFEDGTLRLSSFSEFSKHRDEARLDTQEGKGLVVHQHRIGDGQHIAGWLTYGEQSYVLCGAMRHDLKIMNAFDADSAIRINDTVRFADCIAHHIPGFTGGAEGPCIYLPNRIVHRNLGPVDERVLHEETQPGSISIEKMQSFLAHLDGGDLCFIKHRDYAYQGEYRFLWDSRGLTSGSLTIKVPEAREFCTRLEDLEVELSDC
jgi:hypothetical protein